MYASSKWICDNLIYMENMSDFCHTLFHLNKFTGITIIHSHEGYNYFTQRYVKVNDRVKKNFEMKARELVFAQGQSYFMELIADELAKQKSTRREGK